MLEQLDRIGSEALREVQAASGLESLEAVRIRVLGKKGALSEVLKGLGGISPAERPVIGAKANEWKRKIEEAIESRQTSLEAAALDARLKNERIDITLPSRLPHRGSLHPVTQTLDRMFSIFARLGFDVMTGPEIETDYLCFEAANIPADHPARDMQDTFFMGPNVVLRTHTTSVQMRALRDRKPPIRVLAPGAVYRCDSDATHSPMFHQIEGLWVDKGVRMSDLKGTLQFFAREMFGSDTKIRMRSSFFPFVEPGAEVDVSCYQCGKNPKDSCRICKGTGWLEILGAGMVHPALFEKAGIVGREELTGFAFGIGIDRVAMLMHEIPDLRLMFSGDGRFLRQF
jgi:phenylalanyl-tRNA synthetase alpha chain